ncbi:uncharacterized protein Fot_41526 [Forsythia ovata]|uniref:Uncharacterized protein n=1 Tax=Forsythia ovata TaxID=205694 RepID=A0ABD1RJI0_9LAMI
MGNIFLMRFAEAPGQPSSIPWRSRSQRRELREEMSSCEPVTHSRPLSVAESEFEHFEFGSFGDSTLSASPELPRSNAENVERKNGLKRLSVSGSRSRVAPVNAEASVTGSKTLPFSIGSSLENVEKF